MTFDNLTPIAAAVQKHYLASFQPPTEQTLAVWKSLNTPPAVIDRACQPHITMHQERVIALVMEWERTKKAEHGRRYRLKQSIRRAAPDIAPMLDGLPPVGRGGQK